MKTRIRSILLAFAFFAALALSAIFFIVVNADAEEAPQSYVDYEFDFADGSKDIHAISGFSDGNGIQTDDNSGKTARFADGNQYFSVRATLPANTKGAFLRVWVKGDHQRIDVSNDGVDKNEAGVYPENKKFETLFCNVDFASDGSVVTDNGFCLDGDLWGYALRYFPLDSFLISEKSDSVMLDFKFMDAKTDDGNGINVLGAKVISGRGIDFNGGAYYVDAVKDGTVNEEDLFDAFLMGNHINGNRVYNDKRNYEIYRITLAAGTDPFLTINADSGDYAAVYVYNDRFDGGSRRTVVERVNKEEKTPLTYIRLRESKEKLQEKETYYLFVRSSDMGQGAGVQFSNILVAEAQPLTDTHYEYKSGTVYENAKVTDLQSINNDDDNSVLTGERYLVQGGSGLTDDGVFYDGTTAGIYKYEYKSGIERLLVRLEIYGSYIISMSADGRDWTQTAFAEGKYWRGGGSYETYTIDASAFIRESGGTLYVKIGDYTYWDGFGPHARGMAFVAQYSDERYIDLTSLAKGEEVYADFTDDSDLYGRYMGFVKRNGERFADGKGFFDYKVRLGDGAYFGYIQLNEATNASIRLSTDGQNYEEVWYSSNDGGFVSHDTEYAVRNSDYVKIDLNAFAFDNDVDTVFIRMCSHDGISGSGACARSMRFFRENINAGGKTWEFGEDVFLNIPFISDAAYSYSLAAGQNALFYSDGGDLGKGSLVTDGTSYVVYKVKFPAGHAGMRLLFKGRDRAISYSSDGRRFENLYCRSEGSDGNAVVASGVRYALGTVTRAGGYYGEFELENLLNDDRTIYIRFEDCSVADGYGTQIHELLFCSDLQIKEKATETGKPVIGFADEMVKEIDVSDAALLYEQSETVPESRIDDDGRIHRFADGERWFTYKILFDERFVKAYVMLNMNGDNMLVEVSNDNKEWRTLASSDYDLNGADFKDLDIHYFTLESYLRGVTAENGKLPLYIRFAAQDKERGNGANLYGITVYCAGENKTGTYPLGEGRAVTTVMTAGAGEKAYKVDALSGSDNAKNYTDNGTRYFDCLNHSTYLFRYDTDAEAIRLNIEMQAGYRLSVSTDGVRWYDLDIAEVRYALGIDSGSNNMAVYQYDLKPYLDGCGKVYIRMGDMTPMQGWGGSFTRMILWQYLPEASVEPGKIFEDGKINTQIPLTDESLVYAQKNTAYNYFGKQILTDGYIDYKFELPVDATSFYIAYKGMDIGVKVSADGKLYEGIPTEYYLNGNDPAGSGSTYNLSYFIKEHKTLYIRFDVFGQADSATLYSLYAGYNRTLKKGYDYSEKDYRVFIAGSPEEKDFLVEKTDGIYVGAKYTEFKRNNYAVYKFTYDTDDTKALKFMATVSGSFVISISEDGTTFKDLVISDQQYYYPYTEDNTVRDLYVDVSDYMGTGVLYVRIADLVDDNEYGAQLRGMGIVAMKGTMDINMDEVHPVPSYGNNNGCGSAIDAYSMSVILLVTVMAALFDNYIVRVRDKDIFLARK